MLHDGIAAALPELRAHAESRMTRTCLVRAVTGVDADPETGADVPTYGPTLYQGPCRLRDRQYGSTALDLSGTAPATRSRLELHVPFGSPRIPVGAVVSFEDGTPDYRVTDTADGDDVTARRYPLETVS